MADMLFDLVDRYCNWLFGDDDSGFMGALWRAFASAVIVFVALVCIAAAIHAIFPVTRGALHGL